MKVADPPLAPSLPDAEEYLRRGLAAVLRSGDAPPFSQIVSQLYDRAGIRSRISLLACMLRRVTPKAAAVIAAGAFLPCFTRTGWRETAVTVDDAIAATTSQVADLARYAEQSDPGVIDQICQLLVQDPSLLAVVASIVLAVVMHARGRQHDRADAAAREPT